MMTSCSQNNTIRSGTVVDCHLSTPHCTDYRGTTQTAASSTPRTIKTPIPRIRTSASRLLTSQKTPCEDLDRFIPSRRRMNMDLCRRKLNSASKPHESSTNTSSSSSSGPAERARLTKLAYKKELLSTLCNVSSSDLDDDSQLKAIFQYGNLSPPKTGNLRSQNHPMVALDPFEMDFLRSSKVCFNQQVRLSNRVISNVPHTVLDVPLIVNDFYTHPLSWSKTNILAIALGSTVFLLNESTRAVQELVNVSTLSTMTNGNSNHVKAVKWCSKEGMTHCLAVGTNTGVRVFDTLHGKEIFTSLYSGGSPVRALCWNDSRQWLTVGCTTGKIASLDWRSGRITGMTRRGSLTSSSAVCNLAWNQEGTCLASGRDDKTVHLWDASMMRNVQAGGGPRLILESHVAAVKGLAWCPYQRDLLASGGGTADRCIKLWDTCSGKVINSVNTESQVSSLVWGRHHKELYSGHGFGFTSNTALVWSYPKMERIQTLSYHQERILSMDMSPDGSRLASIGADESLCIWKLGSPNVSRYDSVLSNTPSFGPRCAIR